MAGILFYGDPHGVWDPLADSVHQHRPNAVVLLGDMGLNRPLREELSAIWGLVPSWYWIIGNHDVDKVHDYEFLVDSYADGDIGSRTVEIDGLTIAGLGGVYGQRVWYPQVGNETPVFRTRAEMTRKTARFDRFRGGVPRSSRATIFPEDHVALARTRADILVSHEAPTSHRNGFAAIDDLAEKMGTRLVVHGHHHHSYEGRTVDGIRVVGLSIAQPWLFDKTCF